MVRICITTGTRSSFGCLAIRENNILLYEIKRLKEDLKMDKDVLTGLLIIVGTAAGFYKIGKKSGNVEGQKAIIEELMTYVDRTIPSAD